MPGVTETLTEGFSVTVAVAVLLGSATLVAVTVTTCVLLTLEGAEYNPPEEIDPAGGLSVHVTDVLVVLLTQAVNCRVCEALRLAVPGVTNMDTGGGFSVTFAVALFVGSATLVAVTLTVWVLVRVEGAVNKPLLEIDPIAGFKDHVTLEFAALATVARNC